jgi:hypothetical protein
MKRIIRQDGPKATDRALVAEKLRTSNIKVDDLSEQEAAAIRVPDFHDIEYEHSINHWLSRRSLALLEELAELGTYGHDAAEVGCRFVDQALKQFAQHQVQPEISFEDQFSEVDARGDYEGTINHKLSDQSFYLLQQITKLEIYGETPGEVGARFVDHALQGFVKQPRFVIGRKKSK